MKDAKAGLFSPIQVGRMTLPHRVVMAPMTRSRAAPGNVPTPLMARYYSQRAGAALIVSEATQVSPLGIGYANTPGIHSPEQVAGWKVVTDAVHAAMGRIYLQLWHVGRISHPSFLGGELPVAPSAVKPAGQSYTPTGPQDHVTPRALERREIAGVVDQFRQGTKNAIAAGFDGVEIHGANGYLLDQFLRDRTNRRTDDYGGSVENRARFVLEVVDAVVAVAGGNRVAIRLSPGGSFNDMADSDPEATFGHVVKALGSRGLAYVHLIETTADDIRHGASIVKTGTYRALYPGRLMVNGDYDRERAEALIARGTADLVSFGKLFLANPDLPERLRRNAALNVPDQATFYGGTEKGYTDYAALGG